MTADFVSRHAVEQAGNHPRGRHVGCEQPVDAGKRFRGRVDPFRIIDPDPLRSRTGRQNSRLQSGYALPPSRIRRHFLILIDARFSSCSPRSKPGPPMTLRNAAAARVGLIAWCKIAGIRSNPIPPRLPSDTTPVGRIG